MTDALVRESLERGEWSSLDRHFADLMGRLSGDATGSVRAAAALVSWSRLRGDACLRLEDHAGRALRRGDADDELSEEADIEREGESEEEKIATVMLPLLGDWRDSLRNATVVVGGPHEKKPLILTEDDRLYLRRYWHFEQRVALAVRSRLIDRVGTGALTVDMERWARSMKRLYRESAGAEVDWQQVATFLAVRNAFCVISGGPGTGKTTTVVRILMLLIEQAQSGPGALRIAMAAPTGKAAARLQETLRSARETLNADPEVVVRIPDTVSTVHRLLGTIPGKPWFRHSAENPLPVDVLVVDEASMVDLALMARLLDAMPAHARLILLGDKDQLASVEAGAVLGDLCAVPQINRYSEEFREEYKRWCGTELPGLMGLAGESLVGETIRAEGSMDLGDTLVELKKNYRFGEENDLYRLSRSVNEGDADRSWAILQKNAADGEHVRWRDLPTRGGETVALRELVLAGYGPVFEAATAADALERLARFRILAAVRAGPHGTRKWNVSVAAVLASAGRTPREGTWYRGMPVLVTANDHALRIYNGDLGVVWPDQTGRLDVFFAGVDGEVRAVKRSRLPPHETAYAMTVHKSQGSEFGTVLLVLPERVSPVVTRELLYTGLTRARQWTEVWGKEEAVRRAVETPIRRVTGLRQLLWGKGAG